MTTMISKYSFRSASKRPVFLILLVIMLLIAPASAFASSDDDQTSDSTTTTEQNSPTNQSGGFEGSTPTVQFESPADYEQDTTANFSEGLAYADPGSDNPDTGIIETDSSNEVDTTSGEQELAPPEAGASDADDSTGINDNPALETPLPSSQPDEQSEPTEVNASSETVTVYPGDNVLNDGQNLPSQVTEEAPVVDLDATVVGEATSNATSYFQVQEVSMSPLLNPGSIVEVTSATYADGDMVVAQKSDGTYIVKMLSGDQLVPLGAGTTYPVADVTILGAAHLSSMTAESLELSGLTWHTVLAQTATAPTAGDGSSANPYQISIWENLYWLSQNSDQWGKHFTQTANIAFPADINTWDGGQGWTPIGTFQISGGLEFVGSYNGADYTIINLYINRPTADYIGLFGYTGSSASFHNIRLENVDITGKQSVGGLVGVNKGTVNNCYANGSVEGTSYVGGLVGQNAEGLIENSYASGTVTGTENGAGGLVGLNGNGKIEKSYATGTVAGLHNVGGLVGYNLGSSSEITNSYASGTVTGTGNGVGGLVGWNRNGKIEKSNATGTVAGVHNVGGLVGFNLGAINEGIINNSYANGDVNGTDFVGGLVGKNEGNVTNSYATGSVNGVNQVGGLVGVNFADTFVGTIENSYATGTVDGVNNVGGLVGQNYWVVLNSYATSDVTGTDNVGGLVGQNFGIGTVNSSFYEIKATGNNSIGTGKNATEMKTQDTFIDAGWDFGSTWVMSSPITFGGYPTLQWTGGYAVAPTSGQIASLPNLVWVAEKSSRWTGNYTQTADINMWTTPSWDSGAGWTPIGNDTTKFTGTYDGGGFTISNLYVNRPNDNFIGLFGYIEGTEGSPATIRNVNLIDNDITGDNQVGGLVGFNQYCTLENNNVNGKVSGEADVGGLVGVNQFSVIKNNNAVGTVNGRDKVGGLVGGNEKSTIYNSHADVIVTGSGNAIGGLVGLSDGTIDNSSASGAVTGKDYVGGLVGYNYESGEISNSYTTGSVTGDFNVGGLAGINQGKIGNSYSSANVNGFSTNVGGLVGHNGSNISATITDSYATGNVTGSDYVGGLVGYNQNGTITNSYATGLVNCSLAYVGGLVGDNDEGTVTNSFWDTQTSGQATSDGGTGLPTASMKKLSTFIGAGWDIAGQDGSYPVLGWQVNWTANTWYMGTPPTPDNTNGGSFGGGFSFFDFGFPPELALLAQNGTGLTTITGQGNAPITPGIIVSGSWNDLNQAVAAYQAALVALENSITTLSPDELALLEVELVIARAAILALEAKLLDADGLPFNLAALQSAYAAAVATVTANQSALSAGQMAAANQLLAAIAGAITALQQINT